MSSIQLSPAERGAFAHFFALADPQNTGVVSGNNAVSFFALSGLHPTVLGAVWEMSDRDQNGFLTPAHFSIALRLIGHAQGGKVVTEDLVNQPGPMPTFKGITLPAHLAGAGSAQVPGSPAGTPSRKVSAIMPQATGGSFSGTATVGEIRPEDRARYTRIFAGANPQAGMLDGEKAKNIFVKSKLPFDQLGQIWNLADTKSRGQLDLTDFIIGMHFIQCTMNGSLKQVPSALPPGLYEKASTNGPATTASGNMPGTMSPQMTGGSNSGFLSRQMTGPAGGSHFSPAPGSPAPSSMRAAPGTAVQPQRTGMTSFASQQQQHDVNAWAVDPTEKAKSDSFFDGLDQDKKGVLDGAAAVPFFLQSGLGESVLAHVWDLSDITQSGTLSRDEFAVAMHLINKNLTGSELPQELPSNLIPPSLRNQSLPQAVNPQQTDTQKDLFSLMDDDIDLPVSTTSAFAKPAGAGVSSPSRAAPAVTAGADGSKGAFDSAFDDDFMTSGAKPAAAAAASGIAAGVAGGAAAATMLSPQATGASASSRLTNNRAAGPFGDSSTEAANHRLALESTQKSLSDLETSKADLTKSVGSDAESISDLKTRLETVRMRHQTESEAVSALRQRYASQAAELKRMRDDSVREESELSRLRAEKDELEQALMKEREDVRELNRVASERTKEKDALKAEIEKVKKDSRQQKGLLAIGKKQVSQAESDVSKAREELEQAKLGESEEVQTAEHAVHGEVPMKPAGETAEQARSAVASPALSTRSYNPFDRLGSQAPGASPHPSSATTMGTAALGGAAAAGLGTAAIAHHAMDAEGEDQRTAQQKADDDDPFGLNTHAEDGAHDVPAPEDDFDDNFGADAAASKDATVAQPTEVSGRNDAFDDAFADINEPAAGVGASASPPQPAAEAISTDAPIPTANASEHAAETEDASASVPGSFAPVDEAIQQDQMKDTPQEFEATSSSLGAPEAAGAGTAHTDALEPHAIDKGKGVSREEDKIESENDNQSSDEDEGPEDLERDGRRFMGASQRSEPDSTPAQGFGQALTTDGFERTTAQSESGAQPLSASPQALMAPPVAPFPSHNDVSQTHSASGVSDSDAFHDTSSEAAHAQDALTKDRSASVESSANITKARRAPPAIPSRGAASSGSMDQSGMGTGAASAAGGAGGAALGAGAASAAVAQNSPMDDFDAAFEDLGPAATNGAANNPADVSQNAGSGFDDTFGDTDGFDFVPSFSSRNIAHGSGSGSANASQTLDTNSGAHEGAFHGFDSAFGESPFDQGADHGSRAAPGGNPGQTTNASSSGAGSGFSFEDAFAPSDAAHHGDANAAQQSAPAASIVPPPAPPRSSARPLDGAGGTAAVAPAASTGALPDDAGPVKQLCQMGFSRADVIKALERSNYRTEKALERLLAQ